MPPRIVSPHALLSDMVQGFWLTERVFLPPNDTFDILPDSMVDLVCSFGADCFGSVADQPEQPLPACYLVGLLEQPVRLRAHGVLTSVRVHLYPWGIAALLGTPRPHAIPGIFLPDDQLAAVAADFAQWRQPEQLVSALECVLIDRVRATTLRDPIMVQAARHILDLQGNLTIEPLAAATSLSARTLRRRFGALLGTPPKQLARTVRFEAVRDALWHRPDTSLAELAIATGYADQAHLQREFRRFSQRTPRQSTAEMRQTRRLFSGDRNLQDREPMSRYTPEVSCMLRHTLSIQGVRTMRIRLGTINLFVRDMEQARRFYVEVLGLTENTERSAPPGFILLEAGECTLALQDRTAPGAAFDAARSIELGFAVDDVEAVRMRLLSAGASVSAVQQMGWGSGCDTTDPEGHRLTLYRMGIERMTLERPA